MVAVLIRDASSVGANAGYVKRISNHLAAALLLFCLLQIGIVVRLGGSLVLHLSGLVAIGVFAVVAKGLERRWETLDQLLGDQRAALQFRRDITQLWLASIVAGLLWLPLTLLSRSLFG